MLLELGWKNGDPDLEHSSSEGESAGMTIVQELRTLATLRTNDALVLVCPLPSGGARVAVVRAEPASR